MTGGIESMTLPTLPESIFNRGLLEEIKGFWFKDIPKDTISLPFENIKHWYGLGDEASKMSFDNTCHDLSIPALRALNPTSFPLPEFVDFETDRRNAEAISRPFRDFLMKAKQSGMDLPSATVALSILLDQMPRNTHRDIADQKVVFSHYDRIARALIHFMFDSEHENDPLHKIDEAPEIRNVAFYRSWLYLPLEHSEDIADQRLLMARIENLKQTLVERGESEALEHLKRDESFAQKHLDIIEKFGRFPHRNPGLGRTMSSEEQAYLDAGGDTFGVSTKK